MFSSSLHAPPPSFLPLHPTVRPHSFTTLSSPPFLSQSSPSLRSLSLSSFETLVPSIPYSSLLFVKVSLLPWDPRSPRPSLRWPSHPRKGHLPFPQRRGSAGRAGSARSKRSATGLGSEVCRGVLQLLGSPRRGAVWGNMAASGLPPGPALAWPRPLPGALRPPLLPPRRRGGRFSLSLPLPPPRHGEELELWESWLPAGRSTAAQRGLPVQVTRMPGAPPSARRGWRGARDPLDGAPNLGLASRRLRLNSFSGTWEPLLPPSSGFRGWGKGRLKLTAALLVTLPYV